MRKIISFVLILLLCSCLVSCSDKTKVGAVEVVVSKDYRISVVYYDGNGNKYE